MSDALRPGKGNLMYISLPHNTIGNVNIFPGQWLILQILLEIIFVLPIVINITIWHENLMEITYTVYAEISEGCKFCRFHHKFVERKILILKKQWLKESMYST